MMTTDRPQTYTAIARFFHWATVAILVVSVPLGVGMVIRGSWLGIWDGLTNAMYSSHKLLGVMVFFVVAARLAYRVVHGAPGPAPTVQPVQRRISGAVHASMYALLLMVPVAGWFGVQLYPALDLFGVASLPAVVAPDKAASTWVLALHAAMAFTLVGLITLHVGAALFHRFVRRDGVLQRMLPGAASE
ncbi:MAG: cytochrome b [Gemmatimonadaceae bacterium]|nr:cytochrome b [Acetobacteraceae bacterium]